MAKAIPEVLMRYTSHKAATQTSGITMFARHRRAPFGLVAQVCHDCPYCGGGSSLISYRDNMIQLSRFRPSRADRVERYQCLTEANKAFIPSRGVSDHFA